VATDVEYSADGSLFAALSMTPGLGSVALWRSDGGRPTSPILMDLDMRGPDLEAPSGRGEQLGAVKFSPDGARLYASGSGSTVVFATASGEELHRIGGNGILAVSPDGRMVAVRDGSFAVRIVDSSGVAPPITIPVLSFPLVADFSPDSRQLAIATGTGVDVASTETGEIAETLRSHAATVIAVGFRPTGELVTAGEDGAIITWDLGDWSARFRTETFTRESASLQLDERTVALEKRGGLTQAIVAEPAVWEERACRIAGRVLTEQEWTELFRARPYVPACRE
jgi:WD40 repeat protein